MSSRINCGRSDKRRNEDDNDDNVPSQINRGRIEDNNHNFNDSDDSDDVYAEKNRQEVAMTANMTSAKSGRKWMFVEEGRHNGLVVNENEYADEEAQ